MELSLATLSNQLQSLMIAVQPLAQLAPLMQHLVRSQQSQDRGSGFEQARMGSTLPRAYTPVKDMPVSMPMKPAQLINTEFSEETLSTQATQSTGSNYAQPQAQSYKLGNDQPAEIEQSQTQPTQDVFIVSSAKSLATPSKATSPPRLEQQQQRATPKSKKRRLLPSDEAQQMDQDTH